jgi:hypothetical protein
MKTITIIMSIMLATFAKAQYTIDFENFTFPDSLDYDNGSDSVNLEDGFFEFYPLKFPNLYNDAWGYWESGWAISSVKDSVTVGFTNLYASRPGGAASGDNYVVGQNNTEIIQFEESYEANYFSFKYTNSTYAALSMRDGDMFAKKFGGQSGDDPDYFFLRMKLSLDSVEVFSQDIFLADFRFEDNSQDYIVEDWRETDYYYGEPFNKISFQLFSSDTGAFGINTPLFFCLDDITIEYFINSTNEINKNNIKLFPNPTKDFITIQTQNHQTETFQIIDLYGRVVRSMQIIGQQTLDVQDLAVGIYMVRGEDGSTSRFVKQ